MPIPVGKAALTAIRYVLRPINNTLIKNFKSQHGQDKKGVGFNMFCYLGQSFNRLEVSMNRIIIQQTGLGEIKRISDDAAFNKGVDWFTEIVFFYGVLFGIAFYELDKTYRGVAKQQKTLKDLEDTSRSNKTRLEQMKTDVERVKVLQIANKKDIRDLENQVSTLERKVQERLRDLQSRV